MPVIQAKSAGFCYGVRRAVELAEKTARENGGCVMLGSIIHNANVVAQLERLEGFIAHKKELYDHYVAALDGVKGLHILPFREEECRSNHWFFSLYLKDSGLDRDTVIEKLQAQHIQTRPVWALIHEQADYPRNEAYALDKAEDYRKYIVNLPCSTNLSMEDCERVCQAVLAL